MQNPFANIRIKSDEEVNESDDEYQGRVAKRNAIYKKYDLMVNEILDLFIAAHQPGMWIKDSDCSRSYCCHIAWFAGPKEEYSDPYDKHHTIRRRIEITLEMDGLCNPTGFKVTNYEAINKIIHVGLEKEDLVYGVKKVME